MNEMITIKQIIDYSMDRIITILEEVSTKGIQLISPDKVHKLLPSSDYNDFFNNDFSFATLRLKKTIESALLSLKMCPQINEMKEFVHYQKVLCKMI